MAVHLSGVPLGVQLAVVEFKGGLAYDHDGRLQVNVFYVLTTKMVHC